MRSKRAGSRARSSTPGRAAPGGRRLRHAPAGLALRPAPVPRPPCCWGSDAAAASVGAVAAAAAAAAAEFVVVVVVVKERRPLRPHWPHRHGGGGAEAARAAPVAALRAVAADAGEAAPAAAAAAALRACRSASAPPERSAIALLELRGRRSAIDGRQEEDAKDARRAVCERRVRRVCRASSWLEESSINEINGSRCVWAVEAGMPGGARTGHRAPAPCSPPPLAAADGRAPRRARRAARPSLDLQPAAPNARLAFLLASPTLN